MSDLPDIQRGDHWSSTSARQWQNLMRLAESFDNLSVGQGLELVKTSTGVSINRIDERGTVTIDEMPVAVLDVGQSTDEPRRMIVRGVDYGTEPPELHLLAWRGEPFVAYPEVGATWNDYENYAWPDENPDPGMPLLQARRRGEYWYVQRLDPGGPRMVIVKAFEGDSEASRYLIVQEVTQRIVDGAWDGTMTPIGEVVTLPCWPPLRAGHFRAFLWEPDTLDDVVTILPLWFSGGAWWVAQQPRLAIVRRSGPRRLLDCTSV